LIRPLGVGLSLIQIAPLIAIGAMGASMPLYSTLTMLVTLSYPGGSTPGVWPSTEM
jgi:hypothetical protein